MKLQSVTRDNCAHNEVDEGEEEEENDNADRHVPLASSQSRLVEPLLLNGDIARLEVAVVLLVDITSLHRLLPHGLLHWAVGTLL